MECSNRFPSFGRFEWVPGLFLAKKDCLGAKNAQFWEGAYPGGTTGPRRQSLGPKTWIW